MTAIYEIRKRKQRAAQKTENAKQVTRAYFRRLTREGVAIEMKRGFLERMWQFAGDVKARNKDWK